MTRRKFVQIDGELVEVDPYTYQPTVRTRYQSDAWMDGVRSPIDGGDIGSRSKLREHMRLHNVGPADELAQDAWRHKQERERAFQKSRLEDLRIAADRLRSGHRPNIQQSEE